MGEFLLTVPTEGIITSVLYEVTMSEFRGWGSCFVTSGLEGWDDCLNFSDSSNFSSRSSLSAS